MEFIHSKSMEISFTNFVMFESPSLEMYLKEPTRCHLMADVVLLVNRYTTSWQESARKEQDIEHVVGDLQDTLINVFNKPI